MLGPCSKLLVFCAGPCSGQAQLQVNLEKIEPTKKTSKNYYFFHLPDLFSDIFSPDIGMPIFLKLQIFLGEYFLLQIFLGSPWPLFKAALVASKAFFASSSNRPACPNLQVPHLKLAALVPSPPPFLFLPSLDIFLFPTGFAILLGRFALRLDCEAHLVLYHHWHLFHLFFFRFCFLLGQLGVFLPPPPLQSFHILFLLLEVQQGQDQLVRLGLQLSPPPLQVSPPPLPPQSSSLPYFLLPLHPPQYSLLMFALVQGLTLAQGLPLTLVQGFVQS